MTVSTETQSRDIVVAPASATVLLLLRRIDCNDGVASYVENIAAGLRAKGDRVVIISGCVTTGYGSETRRISIASAVTEWIVLPGFERSRLGIPYLVKIISAIRRHRVSVVSPQGFAVLPAGFLVGLLTWKPLVTNFHLLPAYRPRLEAFQKLLYRLVTAAFPSDRYLATSTEIATFFRQICKISPAKIHKQLLGVDTDFYRSPTESEQRVARERFRLDGNAIVCVMPARMNKSKGHDVAVEALRLLRIRRPRACIVCLFAGAGDEQEAIMNNALRDDQDRQSFQFLGFIDRDTMRDVYWASDIVLLPSRIEGFGLVVAEAMCCGAVPIRTRSGGWQDQIVEGQTGYSIAFDDPDALAQAIEKVIDAADRSIMRSEAMHLASTTFARSRMIDGTSLLYRETAALGKRPKRALPASGR